MRIILIRHASTDHNFSGYIKDDNLDLPLSSGWRREIKNTIYCVNSDNIIANKIYISPSKRAAQTAKAIFKVCKFKVVEEFSEIDKGFEKFLVDNKNKKNLTVNEWEKIYNTEKGKKRMNFKYPSGITLNQYISKIINKFLEIVNKTGRDKNLVIVSHNGPIKAILTEVLGGHKELYYNIEIQNGKYTEINYEDGSFRLVCLNR